MILFFIRQHRSLSLLFLFTILIGSLYFIKGQKEAFPNIGFDVVTVSTTYPGASAQEVDQFVTKKIEDALKNIEGRKELTSTSSEGVSYVRFVLDPDANINISKVKESIKEEITKIQGLPDDAKDPVVKHADFRNNQSIINVMFSGANSYEELRQYVDVFERKSRKITGVGSITKSSYRESQVWVEVFPQKLKFYDLEISEVIKSLKNRNLNVSAGKLVVNDKEIFIKAAHTFTNLQEVGNIIVRANDVGNIIYVKDVASVSWKLEDIPYYQRVNGEDAIGVKFYKLESGDVITIAQNVLDLVEEYKTSINDDNVKIFYYDDISVYVKRRLGILSSNATFGLILVFFCLILFFDFRITFWTTMGIPFSFCLAVIVTYAIGITLNLMSMFGFIIVIGMIVDDAILIAENIYRRNELGEDLLTATVNGTREMLVPILAIVATTIASFLPLVLLPGVFGKILGIIPKVVIITMLASFIECIFFLPGHIAHMKEKKKKNDASGNPTKQNLQTRGWFLVVQDKYANFLAIILKRRILVTTSIVFFSIAASFLLFKQIPFVFFPGEVERATISVEMPSTYSKDKTKIIADSVEKEIKEKLGQFIKENITYIGMTRIGGWKNRTYAALFYFTLKNDLPIQGEKVIEKMEAIMKEIKQKEKNIVRYEVDQVKGGPPAGKPIDVKLTGQNLPQLIDAAKEVAATLTTFSNVTSIIISGLEGKEELVVQPNEEKTHFLDITYAAIANSIRNAFSDSSSITATSMQRFNDEIDIIVKYEEKDNKTVDTLVNTLVKNKKGTYIPLKNFVSINYFETSESIQRDNGELYIYLSAQLINPRNKTQNLGVVLKTIRDKEKSLQTKYPKFTHFVFGGEKEQQDELQQGAIQALLLSFFGIFFVLTTVFRSYIQPLIVMTIVPFSFLGVLAGLFINSVPLGLMPLLGMVALLGVVVNDSLVMVDYINRLRYKGMQKNTAILFGAKTRLRPILMTSLTTIVGLCPLAYGLMGAEPFLAPMAITFLWGILFSTFVLIFFLPLIYSLIDSLSETIFRLFKKEYFVNKIKKHHSYQIDDKPKDSKKDSKKDHFEEVQIPS